jgi:hypothetical protein
MDPQSANNSPQNVDYPINPEERVVEKADPLALSIEDDELVKVINKRVKDYKTFFTKNYNLFERRKKNEMYLFGRQVANKELMNQFKDYEVRYLDNVLYEIEASIKAVAMSRLPDMIIMPGNDTEESRENAEELSKAVDSDLKKRETRTVLGKGFKHLPIYFTGIIKIEWNPEKDDFQLRVVHPDYVEIDHTATTTNADDMQFIAESIPITVQECIMRFPSAKEEFFEALRNDGVIAKEGEPTWKDKATEIVIKEVWFTWYVKKEGGEPSEFERVEGVMWKYKDCILKKMKNPNYDYQGTEKYFTYQTPGDKATRQEVTPDMMLEAVMTGQMPDNVVKEQIYFNYFDMPRKPYYFLGFDQWNKIAYDETSRVEQNVRNQESLDTQGKQIVETLKNKGKHIFSKDGGIKAEDMERMDFQDPAVNVLIEGNTTQTHKYIPPERPDAAQFNSLGQTRDRMYGLAGASAIRGDVQSDVATTNQIAREADFTRADDIVEDTINGASEWIAAYELQFIKLRYTENHMRRLMGSKGSAIFISLHRDMVEDGMEVTVKSSGTDKLKTQKTAMEMAGMQLVDPLQFYRDMGLDDPEGRTERLLTFTTNPAEYLAKYVMNLGNNPAEMAATLNGTPPGVVPPPAPSSGVVPSPGVVPQQPSPIDTTAVPVVPSGSPNNLI